MSQAALPGRAGDPTPTQLASAAATLDMLSQPTRLHMMWLLCHSEHDVGQLAQRVGASVSTVSQHLAKLRMSGLVTARRAGRHQFYTADDPHVLLLVEQAFARAEPGAASATEPGQAAQVRRRPRPHAPTGR